MRKIMNIIGNRAYVQARKFALMACLHQFPPTGRNNRPSRATTINMWNISHYDFNRLATRLNSPDFI